VIAANRGYCFGVGFEISLACDFRIASETCFYALPEQRLGQIPGSGGSARLQKIIGITRTKDIVMRSKRIPAKQALTGASPPNASPTTSSKTRPTRWSMNCALLAAGAAHRQDAAQRHRGHQSRIAIELEGHCYSRCANPTISAKASRPSTPSARRCFAAPSGAPLLRPPP
jgi:2-oxoglutaroyl-CoA hydrolase